MRRLVAGLLAALLLGSQASATAVQFTPAYGGGLPLTFQALGQNSAAGGFSTVAITTNQDCPAGSLIVVFAATSSGSVSSVTDNATGGANSYASPFDNTAGASIALGWDYAVNTTHDLPSGGTITVNFSVGSNINAAAACVQHASTISPLDTHGHAASGSSTTSATTVSTGALSLPNEIVLGGLATSSSAGLGSAISCGGSYTSLANANNQLPSIGLCAVAVNNGASTAFSPTWSSSTNYVSDVVSFKGQ